MCNGAFFLKICTYPTDLFVNWTSISLVLFCTHVLNTLCSKWSDVNCWFKVWELLELLPNPCKESAGSDYSARGSQQAMVMLPWYLLGTLQDFIIALLIFQWKCIILCYFDILYKYRIILFSTRLNSIQVDDDVFPI